MFDYISINYFLLFFQRELFQNAKLLVSLLPMTLPELAPLVFLSAVVTKIIEVLRYGPLLCRFIGLL